MKELDYCTLWWVVQWDLEYLARHKDTATKEEAQSFGWAEGEGKGGVRV